MHTHKHSNRISSIPYLSQECQNLLQRQCNLHMLVYHRTWNIDECTKLMNDMPMLMIKRISILSKNIYLPQSRSAHTTMVVEWSCRSAFCTLVTTHQHAHGRLTCRFGVFEAVWYGIAVINYEERNWNALLIADIHRLNGNHLCLLEATIFQCNFVIESHFYNKAKHLVKVTS